MSTPSGIATKPLGYSYIISQGVLHAPIPADPMYPSLPAPDYYDDFVVAMGIGTRDSNDAAYGTSDWMQNPPVGGKSGLFAKGFQRSGLTDSERKPGWTYNFPEGTSVHAMVGKAFAAFNNYGAIPTDQEDDGKVWEWSGSDNVTKERRVFFYATTYSHDQRDADFDLSMALYGLSGDQWIYPDKNGETVRALVNRGPNQWTALFDLYQWMNENQETIQQAVVLIASVAVCIASFGALTAPAIIALGAYYAAMQAALAAMKTLAVSIQTGDVVLAVQSIYKAGQAMYAASSAIAPADTKQAVEDVKKKISTEAGNVTSWASNFAAPVSKLYDQAKALSAQVRAVGDQGEAIAKQMTDLASKQARVFPAITQDYWKNAFDVSSVGAGVKLWATQAQGLGKDQLGAFIDSVPWYAKEAAGLGASVRAAEIAQSELPIGGGMHFGSVVSQYDARNPNYIQLRADLAPLVRATWPKPGGQTEGISRNMKQFLKTPGSYVPSPTFTQTSAPAKAVAGLAVGGIILYALKDYALGKFFDRLFAKVLP